MEQRIAKIFMNGSSQAIRLPKEFRFDHVSEVSISRVGSRLYIEPVVDSWDKVFEQLDALPDDLELERSPVDYSVKNVFK